MAAIFRPEGEKRPPIGAEESERASGASLMLAWILYWAMKLVSFLLYNLRIYITCSAGVVGVQGLWRGAKRGQGPPYFDPKGRSGPLFGLSSDEPLHVSLSFIFLSCYTEEL